MSLADSPRVAGPMPLGLPMPTDRSLLDPATPRVRVRTVGDRFPFPVPNGWYCVATGAELAPGAVLARHYFGRDLAVYRTGDGQARVVDAYCAHLGAHLAVGGKVEDGCIVCPFHGWRYDGASGHCVDIPYARSERIPARAAVRAYPVVERNGLVFAWHHADDGEPFYEVPDVAELADPGWLPPQLVEFRVATSCQEIAENNHDHGHFKYVHGLPDVPVATEVVEGTYKRVESVGIVREAFGLGIGTIRLPGVVLVFTTVSAIDEENVHVRWIFTAPAEGDGRWDVPGEGVTVGPDALAAIIKGFTDGVTQDIPLWENKVYRERPVLMRGEGGIATHRRWCEQFYS